MISVVILTMNEEMDLPGCLASLEWCDDIHVVDSGSTDNTVQIATCAGAKTYFNSFNGFGQQRNWALDNCCFHYDWILFLDADERSTSTFHASIINSISKASSRIAGFYCCWKTILGHRWLKKSDNFPKWQFRILRKSRARFIDSGHGQKEGIVEGSIAYIHEPYLHFAFSRGWDIWEQKHILYAQKDAIALLESSVKFRDLISPHGSRRNTAIKRFVRLIPGWPTFRFIYTYFLKGGWTEGAEAFLYCRKMLWYEIQVKRELRLLSKSYNRKHIPVVK
ncbi:MAG: glycosyltransferase family 2 protein [Cyanobacteriota bacterium]|jgi:glycosyltransferase involved in cell wall biosynthesis